MADLTAHDPRWIAFADRWPPSSAALDDPTVVTTNNVLVTNNITARDRMGRMSHVWWVMPIKSQSKRKDGEVVAFTDGYREIHALTHWFDPFAATTSEADAQVPEDMRRDAERYRYLRRQPVDGGPYGRPRIAIPTSATSGDFVNEEDADVSIDAAIAAAPAPEATRG